MADVLEIIAIILSVVALIVTVIGFFASLGFYQEGMRMQGAAEKALAKIEERASAIQTQVGGMFEKTLDAALGRPTTEEAGRQQGQLLRKADPKAADVSPTHETRTSETKTMAMPPPTDRVIRYYALDQSHMTDITEPNSKSVFSLGSSGRFYLFDGLDRIIFFGGFLDVEPAEIVARTRMLFSNIENAYQKVEKAAGEPLSSEAKQVLDRISVDIQIDKNVSKAALKKKIDEYQPQTRKIDLILRTIEDYEAALEEEYRKMTP